MKTPEAIVAQMLAGDAYSQWLDIRIDALSAGSCTLSCDVREEMLNGFGIAHGGITYSLSDSALAFAANGHGRQCVSIETSIAHIKPVRAGDRLTAVCTEIQTGKTIARYVVDVFNQNREAVARFNGTVFRTEKEW